MPSVLPVPLTSLFLSVPSRGNQSPPGTQRPPVDSWQLASSAQAKSSSPGGAGASGHGRSGGGVVRGGGVNQGRPDAAERVMMATKIVSTETRYRR